MIELQLLLPKLSMGFGILSIVLLSCDDFRRNIRKFISRWRYYFAGSLFVSINLFVYIVLTHAFIMQSSSELIYDSTNIMENCLNLLMPVVLAFVYFGAGAGSFRLGNKEIQLNKKLRDTLEGMFNSRPLGPEDVHYSDKETEQLYVLLKEKTEKVEMVARDKKWNRLLARWDEFKEDETVLKEQITYLKKINHELAQIRSNLIPESPAADKLSEVMIKIQERVRHILKRLIKKAQKLLVAYAFKYYKDEAELEKYLIGIEVLDDTPSPSDHIPNIVNRGLILGFMFGLLFGPLFGYFKNEDVVYYCWRGAIALMLFTGFISYGVHCGRWKKSVLIAGLGGYIAHFSWILIDKENFSALKQPSFDWIMDPLLYKEPIVGLSYGIATALILYALKFFLSTKVGNKCALYAIATLTGAGVYPILNVLLSSNPITYTTPIITAWIGAIAMFSMALAVNIGRREEERPNAPNAETRLLYSVG